MIAVTSATGNIGLPLVKMLREARAPVRVLARDPARARQMLGPDVEIVDAASPGALAGARAAFFLAHAGPELGDAAAAFARAAKAAGVAHVVAISSGTIHIQPQVAIGRWHLALEQAIEASGVGWTFLRPGNFASNALRWAPMIRARGTVFAARPDAPSAPIDPFDIAAVAAAALLGPGHEGKTYTLDGPAEMSARDQVAVIGEAIGKPLTVVEVSPEQARDGMVKGGVPPHMAEAIVELIGRGGPRRSDDVHAVTGRTPRPFATWVAEQRAAFA